MLQKEKVLLLLWGVQLLCSAFPGPLFPFFSGLKSEKQMWWRSGICFLLSGLFSGSVSYALLSSFICFTGFWAIRKLRQRPFLAGPLLEVALVFVLCILFLQLSSFLSEPLSPMLQMMDFAETFYVLQALMILHLFTIPFILNGISSVFCKLRNETVDGKWAFEEQWMNFSERSLLFVGGLTGSFIPMLTGIFLRLVWMAFFRRDKPMLRLVLAFAGIFLFVVSGRLIFSIPFLP